MIRVVCPSCGKGTKTSEHNVGRRAKCPHCAGTFVIRPVESAEEHPLSSSASASAHHGSNGPAAASQRHAVHTPARGGPEHESYEPVPSNDLPDWPANQSSTRGRDLEQEELGRSRAATAGLLNSSAHAAPAHTGGGFKSVFLNFMVMVIVIGLGAGGWFTLARIEKQPKPVPTTNPTETPKSDK